MLGVTSPVGTHTFVSSPPTIWHRKTISFHPPPPPPRTNLHPFYSFSHPICRTLQLPFILSRSPLPPPVCAHHALIFSPQLYGWSFSLDTIRGECCLCNRWPQLHTWVAVALNSLSDLSWSTFCVRMKSRTLFGLLNGQYITWHSCSDIKERWD